MNFDDTQELREWRLQVRDFLKTERPNEYDPGAMSEGNIREQAWWSNWKSALSKKGWVAPAWPKEYGGAGLGVMEQFIMNEEFAESEAPAIGGSGVGMLGPTLIVHGSEEQKSEHLGRILQGESIWCQGYSEPGSGSDLASLQTRAVRDGDDYVLNGQKIWTSGAHQANWMFMLARTDPDAPKHRGISYFLIDMETAGINIRPLVNMGNMHHFNEVFFEDVRVPAKNIVGELNRGWYIGATTLDFERSMIGSSVGHRKAIEKHLEYWRSASQAKNFNVAAVRNDFADRWIEATTAKMLSYRVVNMQASGEVPNSEASIAKLFSTELSQRIAGTAIKMLGLSGLRIDGDAPQRGRTGAGYVSSVSATIAGGTSEIQRNIIATRGLGLPRA